MHMGLAGALYFLSPNQGKVAFNGIVTLFVLQNGPCRALTFSAGTVSHLQDLHTPSCRLKYQP